jgi:hypothetical protein
MLQSFPSSPSCTVLFNSTKIKFGISFFLTYTHWKFVEFFLFLCIQTRTQIFVFSFFAHTRMFQLARSFFVWICCIFEYDIIIGGNYVILNSSSNYFRLDDTVFTMGCLHVELYNMTGVYKVYIGNDGQYMNSQNAASWHLYNNNNIISRSIPINAIMWT